MKLNPEEARHYERSVEEENMREYLDEDMRDNNRYLHLKHSVKTGFFKVRAEKPPILDEVAGSHDPI